MPHEPNHRRWLPTVLILLVILPSAIVFFLSDYWFGFWWHFMDQFYHME